MFCPKCGAQVPDGSPFCASCGAPMAQQQPQQPMNQGGFGQPMGRPGASGNPFDFNDIINSFKANISNIGGLGIHLIRRYMDSMNYERVNGQNILTLRKRLK